MARILQVELIAGQFLMHRNTAEALTSAHTVHLVDAGSTRWPPTLRPRQPTWALSPLLGSCHPQPPLPCIY